MRRMLEQYFHPFKAEDRKMMIQGLFIIVAMYIIVVFATMFNQ